MIIIIVHAMVMEWLFGPVAVNSYGISEVTTWWFMVCCVISSHMEVSGSLDGCSYRERYGAYGGYGADEGYDGYSGVSYGGGSGAGYSCGDGDIMVIADTVETI